MNEEIEKLDVIFGDVYLHTKKFADDLMVFWREGGSGYTRDINQAGVWPLSEALKISNSPHTEIVPILKSDLKIHLKTQTVVNKEHSDNWNAVKHLEELVGVYQKQYENPPQSKPKKLKSEYPICDDCGVEMYQRFTDPMTNLDGFGCPDCGWSVDEQDF